MNKEEVLKYIQEEVLKLNIKTLDNVSFKVKIKRVPISLELNFNDFYLHGAINAFYPSKFVQYKQFLLINDIKQKDFEELSDKLIKLREQLCEDKEILEFQEDIPCK